MKNMGIPFDPQAFVTGVEAVPAHLTEQTTAHLKDTKVATDKSTSMGFAREPISPTIRHFPNQTTKALQNSRIKS